MELRYVAEVIEMVFEYPNGDVQERPGVSCNIQARSMPQLDCNLRKTYQIPENYTLLIEDSLMYYTWPRGLMTVLCTFDVVRMVVSEIDKHDFRDVELKRRNYDAE